MSKPVVTVTEDASVKAVARNLVDHDVSMLVVVDGSGELQGVITEADVVRLLSTPHRGEVVLDSRGTSGRPGSAGSVMTREVVAAREDADVAEMARLMVERGIKSIPIVAHRRPEGMLSRRDVLTVFFRADREIHHEVMEPLDNVSNQPLSVTIAEGIVTVEPGVEPSARPWIEHVVRSVPGVVGVAFRESSS